jgi:signal transduction protein with GAF and PtsI domain
MCVCEISAHEYPMRSEQECRRTMARRIRLVHVPMTRRTSPNTVVPTRTRRQAIDALVHSLDHAGPADSAQQLADTAVRELAYVLDVEMAKLLTLDEGGTFLVVAAAFGWDPSIIDSGRVPATVTSQAGYALTVEGPIFFENIAGTKRFSDTDLLRQAGVVSSLVMTLRHHQRVLGVLSVHSRNRRSFTADDMDVLEQVGRALARALGQEGRGTIGRALRSSNARHNVDIN